MEMYIDIDPLEYYSPNIPPNEVGDTLAGIPGLLHKAYMKEKLCSKHPFWKVLEEVYGYPLLSIKKAKVTDGILTYPQDPDSYPLASFILTGGVYGTLLILQYQYGIVHVSGSETFITQMD